MRTNVVIDDELIVEALQLSGLPTKKAVVDAALRSFVRLKPQERIRSLRGQLHLEGDLNEMRTARLMAEDSSVRHGDGERLKETEARDTSFSQVLKNFDRSIVHWRIVA